MAILAMFQELTAECSRGCYTLGKELPPDFEWIAAADTPWGVPVFDVRPVTQGMISASQDPDCAATNALSYTTEDGSSFAEAESVSPRSIPCALQYRVEGNLPDGALFRPWEMEHK